MRIHGLVLGALLLWPCAAALGSTSRSTAPVKVFLLDLLAVTNGGTIILDNSAANPAVSGVLGPVADSAARLNYTSNSAVAKKITAQVTVNPGGSDITLTVSIPGGTGEKTLVAGGATAAAQDVYVNIAAGALTNLPVTYKAQATAAGTTLASANNFVFTVTYTSTN